jgi:DNA-binding transcriptional MerR regulator
MSNSEPLWTIADLGTLVARALAVDYDGQINGQVRDVPDRRTIRYYTTLGLIDRPTRIQGRTALYGLRHLLQLVAIKRLQAAGLSLGEIQQQLLALSSSALRKLARLPADLEMNPSRAPRESRESRPDRAAGPFWSAQPAEVPAAPSLVQSLHGIPLGEDATLLLKTSEPLAAEVVEAIHAAAEPLLQLLESRRLIRPRQKRGNP